MFPTFSLGYYYFIATFSSTQFMLGSRLLYFIFEKLYREFKAIAKFQLEPLTDEICGWSRTTSETFGFVLQWSVRQDIKARSRQKRIADRSVTLDQRGNYSNPVENCPARERREWKADLCIRGTDDTRSLSGAFHPLADVLHVPHKLLPQSPPRGETPRKRLSA